MPHPERASEPWLGSADGRVVIESVVEAYAKGLVARRLSVVR
jgi:phosphoribosylformylglycinamidine (FGAM) synthase-like amidotransferase family enzyme